MIDHFSECCIDTARITVLTPYTDQMILLKSHLSKYAVKVFTFEKAQGVDCDIVIVSCTKSTAETGNVNKELRLINAALTKARMKLIILGAEKYLKGLKAYTPLLNKLHDYSWVENIDTFTDDM